MNRKGTRPGGCALYKDTPVRILDAYNVGGVELATVEALEGTPFVGGDMWPVRTIRTIVRLDDLTPWRKDKWEAVAR